MLRSTALRPVDRLLILYNIGFAVLWLTAIGRYPDAGVLVLAHVLAVVLAVLASRPDPGASRFGQGALQMYPIALITLYWLEMGLVREAFHTTTHDALIAAADLRLFGGVHPHLIWIPAMPWLWFSEIMNAAYWLYYPLVFLAPLVLLLAGRDQQVTDLVFALTLAYAACYVSYALFPVDGPSHTMVKFDGPFTRGFFYRLVSSGTHAGDSMGTAFPSSHVVGAVTAALYALHHLRPRMGALFTAGAVGVILSTVYRQSHFAIDSVVGTVMAVVLFYGVRPFLLRLFSGPVLRPARAPTAAA